MFHADAVQICGNIRFSLYVAIPYFVPAVGLNTFMNLYDYLPGVGTDPAQDVRYELVKAHHDSGQYTIIPCREILCCTAETNNGHQLHFHTKADLSSVQCLNC